MRINLWAVVLLASVALAAGDLWAARAGGGGRGGGGRGGGGGGGNNANGGNKGGGGNKNNGGRARVGEGGDEEELELLWRSSMKEAMGAVAERNDAVMAVVTRSINEADKAAIERLGSWPQLIELSQGSVAAVEIDEADGKDMMKKLNLKSFPGIVWLDRYGNVLMGQAMPDIAAPIVDVANKWKTTVASIEKYFKDHNARAERLLKCGRLREAYIEYAYVAPFKGPEPEKAQSTQTKIKESWLKLVEEAQALPEDSCSRAAIVKGIRREVLALDCAAAIEEALKKVPEKQPAVVAKAPEGADKPEAAKTEPPVPPPAAPPPVVAKAPPPAMPVIENKSLSQLASSAPASGAPVEVEDAGVDIRPLQKATDERLKKAEKLILDGLAAYRKATADSMDRGKARNDLLSDAHAKLELALTQIGQATEGKPDAQMEKLMERVSMLIYGCLKYRSL